MMFSIRFDFDENQKPTTKYQDRKYKENPRRKIDHINLKISFPSNTVDWTLSTSRDDIVPKKKKKLIAKSSTGNGWRTWENILMIFNFNSICHCTFGRHVY